MWTSKGFSKHLKNLQDELEDFNINSENLAEYEQELLKASKRAY